MTIDVDKTLTLAQRTQELLEELQGRRLIGRGRLLRLCLLLMETAIHLRELASGLLMLARQMQQPAQAGAPEKEDGKDEGRAGTPHAGA